MIRPLRARVTVTVIMSYCVFIACFAACCTRVHSGREEGRAFFTHMVLKDTEFSVGEQFMTAEPFSVDLSGTEFRDLSRLNYARLHTLVCDGSPVDDLAPLRSASALRFLSLAGCARIVDLRPLSRLMLTNLNISGTSVTDLSPLTNLPIVCLDFSDTQIANALPLGQMQDLRAVSFMPNTNIHQYVRSLHKLHQIHGLKPEEFWDRYDSGAFDGYGCRDGL